MVNQIGFWKVETLLFHIATKSVEYGMKTMKTKVATRLKLCPTVLNEDNKREYWEMKISVNVSSDKSLCLCDSTDSTIGITAQNYKEREVIWLCHATFYSKKKSWRKKILSWLCFFIFHFFLIYFLSYPQPSTCYPRLLTFYS